jgi:AcrR family transcriptional regulator
MPRNRQDNQKIKDERKEQIRTHALRLFAVKGLAATRITDIAAACGISLGLMYHYYPGKEDIYLDLIRTAYDRMNRAARELGNSHAAPYEKIGAALTVLLDGLQNNENTGHYYMLMAQAAFSEAIPPQAKKIIRKENPERYRIMSRIFRAGQQEGVIKKHDPDELALIFWATISGLAIFKAIHGKKIKMPDAKILMDGFRAR